MALNSISQEYNTIKIYFTLLLLFLEESTKVQIPTAKITYNFFNEILDVFYFNGKHFLWRKELKANIVGPTDLYVKSGSDINLICKISQGPHELGNIFWYKGNDIIDMTTNQNEIDSSYRITVDNDWADGLTSRLKIRRASPNDTGNYTCVPTIAKSSSVYVHVIIGEHPAAMQHNSAIKSTARTSTGILGAFFLGCLQTVLVQFLCAIYVQQFNEIAR